MATRKRVSKKTVGFLVEGRPKVRIGARVEQDLYMLCKMAYLRQGWSLESRIEELLKRDIDSMSKNQWFKEMMSSELFTRYVMQAKEIQASTDFSDFDSNNIGEAIMKNELIDMNEKVRVTARISRKTRALAKGIYPVMGVTLEERIEYLIARDLAKEMRKSWFKKMINRELSSSDPIE